MSEVLKRHVCNTWKMLQYTYGLLGIIAGADKFFNLVTNWDKYVSPVIVKNLPLSLTHFLYIIGVVEIVVGLLILSKTYTKIGAYTMGVWLLIVAVNLLSMGFGVYIDIAVRDIVMAVGAFALACLSDAVCQYHTMQPTSQKTFNK